MAADGCCWNLAESNGWQKPAAQSKFRCLIIEIGAALEFLEGCPANHAALLPALAGRPGIAACWHFPALSELARSGSAQAHYRHRNFVTSFLDPLIAFVSAHPWLAYLDAVPGGPAGGGPGGRLARAGLDHHPRPERAGARRRTAACGRAGGRDRRRVARRRLGVLGRPSRPARNPRAPGRCRDIRG